MIRLLKANFRRLRKSKSFYILILISILIAIFQIISELYNINLINMGEITFSYSQLIGFIIAIFISLFLGVEYQDLVIKNKIIIGHKRKDIYLANLITVSIASLLFYFSYLIIILIIGTPLLDTPPIPISELLINIILIILIIFSYVSIFTFIEMLTYNKIFSTVMNVSVVIIIILSAVVSYNILDEIEFYYEHDTHVEGNVVYSNTDYNNTVYIKDPEWKFYKTMQYLNPFCQAHEISSKVNDMNYNKMALSMLGIIFLFTSSGLIIFNYKNLK